MLAILEVVIALAFIFLLLSVVVAVLNEIWLSFLDKRADFLAEALAELLQDPKRVPINHWNPFQKKKTSPAVGHLYNHGLINALSRTRTGKPSYIGAEPFAAAVLDLITPANPEATRTLDDFRDGITKIENPRLKESLVAILDAAKGDLDKFKAGIRAWFERSMERVTGWYKRYAQQWLLFLALALAVGCNVDTVHIIRSLSTDPNLRAAAVKVATAYSEQASGNRMNTNAETTSAAENRMPTGPESALPTIQTALAALDQLRLPIGWDAAARVYFYDSRPRWGHILTAAFGWLITALAASLGAPFWFDTLQRFINIRGNGRAPDEKDLPTKKPG